MANNKLLPSFNAPILKVILIILTLALQCHPRDALAGDKTYILSYSPVSLFHELVRDRVKEAYQRAGLNVQFIPLPNKRSLLSANNGDVDGDVGRIASIESSFPNLRRVDAKLIDLHGAAYTTRADIHHYDKGLLDHYRIGYVLGVRWAEDLIKGREATKARDYKGLFDLLKENRVDIVLATTASADAVIKQNTTSDLPIRKLEPVIFSEPIYHYLNKKNSAIIPRLEQAIREINRHPPLIFYTGVPSPQRDIVQARLREACRRIGQTCEVRFTGSSQRALVLAGSQGDGDAFRIGTIKAMEPEATDNLLLVPESILQIQFNVYTTGAPFPVNGWESLAGLRNGLRVGVKILEQKIPGNRTILPDSDRLFKMLAENRLDTVVEHGDVAEYTLYKLRLPNIRKLVPPLASFPGYVLIQKKHHQLVQPLADSLAAMKADGSFDRLKTEILNRYSLQTW